MIDPLKFINCMAKKNINFFTGVPDSLLKDLISCMSENVDKSNYLITANEGNAIALATGYHLATGNTPLVFMQNSGLGNCINPLTSLTNKEVYSIPMILLIGWRGKPGDEDEPQHCLPGQILKSQLDLINIPNFKIDHTSEISKEIEIVVEKVKAEQSPVAIICQKDCFKSYKAKKIKKTNMTYPRRHAIETIVSNVNLNDVILSTTGKASRELYEIRKNNLSEISDFMTVGSMGHVSSIALGLEMGRRNNETKKNIICIDGDGSCLMHMGALAILGSNKAKRIKYFLINNGVHESVGGQDTVGFKVDFCKIASACNFEAVFKCKNAEELTGVINSIEYKNHCSFIEVIVGIEDNDKLVRPKETPKENKETFIKFLNSKL